MKGNLNTKFWLQKLELEEFPEPEHIPLRHPVILCHGYGALASLVKPSPLYDTAILMRSHGILAYAPNIVPYARIEVRASEWERLIDQLIRKEGFERINVVAHSMAGLDIRYALSKLELGRQVVSLTTVATPHRGTSLAELALKAPEGVRKKIAAFLDWMGDLIYPETSSDAAGPVKQLTREYILENFNPEIRDVEGVTYYSFSAAAGKGTDHPIPTLQRYQNNYIYREEGLNDGFVSVESARWGGHVSTTHLSHLEQMHLQVGEDREKIYRAFWSDLARHLAEKGH
ncbi:MAG: hypothetical protein R3211_09890 [Balneolaceae bacterium]|nr:hypothetical protein [Balneolaceae bacterium]